MNALVRYRGQILDLVDIERGVSRSAAALFEVITLDRPMGVPVIFHDRQPNLTRGANRSLKILDFLVASGSSPSVDAVIKSGNHHVTDLQPAGLELVDNGLEL